MYALRVDLQTITSDDVVKMFKDADTFVYCIEGEVDNNPHMHVYMETQVKPLALRKRVTRAGLNGNKSYSLKKCEERFPPVYIAYLMKQGKVYNLNQVPQDVLDKAQEVRESYKTQGKKNKMTMVELIAESLVAKQVMTLRKDGSYKMADGHSLDEIYFYILLYYRDHNKSFSKFNVQNLYNIIYLKTISNKKFNDPKYMEAIIDAYKN